MVCIAYSYNFDETLLMNSYRYANSAINFVTDIIITLLPIGVIRSLEIPKRQKNLLYLVFCIGLVYVQRYNIVPARLLTVFIELA
jgi:hypothetical protein